MYLQVYDGLGVRVQRRHLALHARSRGAHGRSRVLQAAGRCRRLLVLRSVLFCLCRQALRLLLHRLSHVGDLQRIGFEEKCKIDRKRGKLMSTLSMSA